MNERNWEYRGLQLSNRNKLYSFQIVGEPGNNITYESDVYNNRNSNGSYSTNVTAGARTFRFRGILYWTQAQRQQAYAELKKIIKVEDFPSISNRGFYTLNRTDKRGIDVTTEAKVYQPLVTTEGKNETLNFEFTLLSEETFYKSQSENTENGGIGTLWGNVLPNVLPNTLFAWTDYIEVTNNGDSKAGMFMQIVGELEKPRITNLTTGQTMRIEKTTKKLVIDNRQKPFIITDEGYNIKSLQTGDYIYLVQGLNKILVSCLNYSSEDMATVLIKYNDTYE